MSQVQIGEPSRRKDGFWVLTRAGPGLAIPFVSSEPGITPISTTILVSDRTEVRKAAFERENDHPIIFSNKLKKAREYLLGKGMAAGPIEDGGGTEFFEIRDVENNVIEICKEP